MKQFFDEIIELNKNHLCNLLSIFLIKNIHFKHKSSDKKLFLSKLLKIGMF